MIVYRDVIPVAGEAVPEGCEWRTPNCPRWCQTSLKFFCEPDVYCYHRGLRFRSPVGYIEPNWLNTLSLD